MSMLTTAFFALPRVKRMPRMPASLSRFNSGSVTVGCSTAMPRAFSMPSCLIASTVTLLSVA